MYFISPVRVFLTRYSIRLNADMIYPLNQRKNIRESKNITLLSSIQGNRDHIEYEYSRVQLDASRIVVWMQHGTHNHIGILLGGVFSLPASTSSLPPNTHPPSPSFQATVQPSGIRQSIVRRDYNLSPSPSLYLPFFLLFK